MSKQPRRLAARTLGTLSVALAAVLTTGTGAHAASTTVKDATGDLYSLTSETPTEVSGPDGDIVSVTTRHSRRQVSIRVRARHLSLDQTLLLAKVRTGPTGPAYFFSGTADIGMRVALMSKGQERLVVCPGIRMVFRPARGYVEAVIPRSCLGSPRWVRTGAALATTDSVIASLGSGDGFDPVDPDGETPSGTIDVAGVSTLTRAQLDVFSARVPLGPKVRVG
jgi:hypothetical protein